MKPRLRVTRVINACVLLELDGDAVLTDPYFDAHWFMRFNEPIGMRSRELPKLAAILGCHRVFDHWRPQSLGDYPHKAETPCLVATDGMRRAAERAGFTLAERLTWGERRELTPCLSVEAVAAQLSFGQPVNSYLLEAPGVRVFVGAEALDLAPLREFSRTRGPVDVALLPIDGAGALGRRLVMTAEEAIEAARILGAKILFPIHYSLTAAPPLLGLAASRADLFATLAEVADLEVGLPPTGVSWAPAP